MGNFHFQLSVKNKNKIVEIDKALDELQDKLRQGTTEKNKPEKTQSKLPSVNQEQVQKTQQQSEEALNNLDKMQL